MKWNHEWKINAWTNESVNEINAWMNDWNEWMIGVNGMKWNEMKWMNEWMTQWMK